MVANLMKCSNEVIVSFNNLLNMLTIIGNKITAISSVNVLKEVKKLNDLLMTEFTIYYNSSPNM